MSDMGDYFRDIKESKDRYKQRRLDRLQPEKKLTEMGFNFKRYNGGLHFRIEIADNDYVDFWPTTQRWYYAKQSGYNWVSLVKLLKEANNGTNN